MDPIPEHYKSLPRPELQKELRRVTGIQTLCLWENLAHGWIYAPVRVSTITAAKIGMNVGDVIGYSVLEGHGTGCAILHLPRAGRSNSFT